MPRRSADALVTLAQTPGPRLRSTRSQLQAEEGAGGVTYMSGLIDSDEFNAALEGQGGVQVYDKMRRSDAQVAALLNACTLPILGAQWDVERPSDTSEAEKISDEHLDFARNNLFTHISWSAFLRHASSCVWAGFAWFEKVYRQQDGQLVLAKLSPRLATSLEKWHVDGAGILLGIQQEIYKDGRHQYLDYPRDKVALFVYQQEANNYGGLSLLRPVYKHWKLKDAYYKLEAIRNERYAVGVPNVRLPQDYTDEQMDQAKAIGKNWKGAEQSYVVTFGDMSVELLQLKGGDTLDLSRQIQHHNEEMAKTGLVQFINYGTTQTGSRALGDSSMAFFYDAAEAWAKDLAGAVDREVLWPLMDLNYAGKIRPTVVFRDLGSVSLGEMVGTLGSVGELYIRPGLDVENALRQRLHLPLRSSDEGVSGEPEGARGAAGQPPSPEQSEEPEKVEPAVQATRHTGAPCTCARERAVSQSASGDPEVVLQKVSEVAINEGDWWRPLRPTERHVALRQIDGMLDDSRDQIMRVLIGARDEWVQSLVGQIREVYADGPLAIMETTIPDDLLQPTRAALLRIQDKLFRFGEEEVYDEAASQAAEAGVTIRLPQRRQLFARDSDLPVDEVAEIVQARTELLLARLKRTTEEAAWQIAAGIYRTQGPDELSPEDVDNLIGEMFERVEQDARLVASMSVAEILNMGRDFGFQAIQDEIRVMEFSAVLDGNTCPACAAVDGKQFAYGSPEYYDLLPPLASTRFGRCRGRGRCRCIFVAILSSESQQAQ